VTRLRTLHFDSLAGLRSVAGAWDDLWQRSDVTLPTLRAELIAQWIEHFARPADFQALAVECDGRLVAALPLWRRRVGRVLDAAAMPCNEWSSNGELLLDASMGQAFLPAVEQSRQTAVSAPPVLDALVAALRKTSWQLLWLDEAVLDAPRWQLWQQALARAGMRAGSRRRWNVGRLEIAGNWADYKSRWSRKHRQKMAWAARRLAKRGDVRLVVAAELAPGDAAAWMRRGFAVEDRGWKGAAGTSVLRTPGMAEFFIRQAETAARWGQLELVFLECGGRPAAFCYGLTAKGVFHSMKVGYDPAFDECAPGQLLRYFLLERFFAEPWRAALDFQGPMTEAHAAWRPRCYTVNRLVVAPGRLLGAVAVGAYEHLWPTMQAILQAGA
jgi:CelD/BcsL family acetyltransferase involved in cellulose biosynthesis